LCQPLRTVCTLWCCCRAWLYRRLDAQAATIFRRKRIVHSPVLTCTPRGLAGFGTSSTRNPILRAHILSAAKAPRAITIRLTGTGAPSEGPYPSIARVPSTTTNWLGSARRGYNGVGTTLAVKVEEAAPTIESRLPAREQMTWGQFDLVVVDHIGMMLPEGNCKARRSG